MKKFYLTILIPFCAFSLFANNGTDPAKKQAKAFRIDKFLKIDGELDEPIWRQAKIANQFVQNEPNPGAPANQDSEVRILYDNTAVYIGAKLYDAHPDSIFKQLSERDDFGNTDWFGIIIDAYQDGTNGVGFFVTPTSIQLDIKYFPQNNRRGRGGVLRSGDRNWDAVWDAEAKITPEGWVVEMQIPYSAIRFPAQEDQIWNINFARQIRRNRESTFWSHVDPAQNGFLQQSGQISGISNIKSPVRLSATPFLAVYGDLYRDKNGDPQNSWGRSFNGGMDIKYGINDAFTLDMTLIPDFGQVQFDNQVLNLSPFEVRFDENRQFFTEGVELFNKGGMFYSRRVGGRPVGFYDVYDNLADGEEVIENAGEAQLINATKISGRTNGGLGVGIFNAISKETFATIENTETGERRREKTNPLTNYNVVVLDQNLKNNSFLTFTNTNVYRADGFYDANSTGMRFSAKNKEQSYELSGRAVLSQKYYENADNDFGHTASLNFRKISGNFQFQVRYNEESDTYDINDLGFLFDNNERGASARINYTHYEPFGAFRRMGGGIWTGLDRLYAPDKFTSYGVNVWYFAVTQNNYGMGANVYFEPIEAHDYFEPRTEDFSMFYRQPTFFQAEAWMSSNYNKKFFFDWRVEFAKFNEDGRYQLFANFEPNVRVSDKLTLGLGLNLWNNANDVGFVNSLDNGDIIFGIRDNNQFETLTNITYTFNNKMSFSFRMRHYWAKAEYSDLKVLQQDGRLGETDYNEFHDNSFNALTIDAVYRWRFAPGSDIFIVWKNNTTQFNDEQESIRYSYLKGVNQLGEIPSLNSLSVKVIYFLDYLALRKKG